MDWVRWGRLAVWATAAVMLCYLILHMPVP